MDFESKTIAVIVSLVQYCIPLTLASASSSSRVMNNRRHGSRSGAVKCRLHLIMPQISQSMGFAFGSCFKPKYLCTLWKVCDMLDLCCRATIIAVQPAANEKLIIKPKKQLEKKRKNKNATLSKITLY